MISKLVRSLLATMVLLLLLVVIGAAFIGFRLLTYEVSGDTDHLAEKASYLEAISDSSPASAIAPNVVLILFDDLGYGDLGIYGAQNLATPNIDRVARNGVRFNQYYAPSPYCTPSRAALLTGRYAPRTGLPFVVAPSNSAIDVLYRVLGFNTRLPRGEITLAEVLQSAGYATAAIGKWHLGDRKPSLPTDFGFDHFFGLHYSNDMTPLALWRDRQQIEPSPADQTTLSARYTDEVLEFLLKNQDKPSFVYLPHTFPHIPLHASAAQSGRSNAGLYGDVIADLDDSVGRIMEAIENSPIERDTIVMITSDNGPWFQGSPGPLRGRKNDVLEGGFRVPFVAWWSRQALQGRVIDTPAMGIDVFPTVLELVGIPLPDDRLIDGVSLAPLLTGNDVDDDRALFYFKGETALAVRNRGYKYLERQPVAGGIPFNLPLMPLFDKGPWLFDMAADESESFNIISRRSKMASHLADLLGAINSEMETNPRGWRE